MYIQGGYIMNKEKITLIVSEKIANQITDNEAQELVNSIKDLRSTSPYLIPLVHITDEEKILSDYEIRINDKKILEKTALENMGTSDLVKAITNDIKEICRQNA